MILCQFFFEDFAQKVNGSNGYNGWTNNNNPNNTNNNLINGFVSNKIQANHHSWGPSPVQNGWNSGKNLTISIVKFKRNQLVLNSDL